MPSNNFDVSTEFPPFQPLPKEEQAKYQSLPKEKKILNVDLRNNPKIDCDSEGQNCHKKYGNIYTGKPKDPSRLTLKLDANTFDRMANSEFGGLRAFFTGKLSFQGNIFTAKKFEKNILDVYAKGDKDKKFGGEL